MASRGSLSLTSASTGVATGTAIALRKPCRAFGVGVTIAGSTKATLRLQGSIDGVNWTDIGAAASTLAASGNFGTTSLTPYQQVRVKQTAMVAHSGGQSVRAAVIGY